MRHLGICDDDTVYLEKAAELIEAQAASFGLEITLHRFSDLTALLQAAEAGEYRLDMLFLDIEFGEMSSFETAKRLSELQPRCYIVFLTNHLSYVMDSYEIPHLYYVIKDEFPVRLEKIFHMYFDKEEHSRIRVSLGGETEFLEIPDIFAVERLRRGSLLHLNDSECRTSLLFDEVKDQMRVPYIIRCHNSFLVNLQHVQKYRINLFVLTNGTEIPISRAYQQPVRELFKKWQEVWI